MLVTSLLSICCAPSFNPSTPGDGGSRFGRSVLTLSDMDGDGVPEFAVGAPTMRVGTRVHGGRVLVFSGATREIVGEWSAESRSTFGQSLQDVGDVDGDGFVDVLVGYEMPVVCEVRSGATGKRLRRFDRAAEDVAPLGDVDGDGKADLLLAAGRYWEVRRGFDGRFITRADWTEKGSRFHPVGDLDGDGLVDGVTSGPVPKLVLSGKGGDVRGDGHRADLSPPRALFDRQVPVAEILAGTEAGPKAAPWGAFPAGDLDGDGREDLVICVRGAADQSVLIGVNGAVVDGARGSEAVIRGWRFRPSDPFMGDLSPFGSSVTAPGDIDGDGLGDLVAAGGLTIMETEVLALPVKGEGPSWTAAWTATLMPAEGNQGAVVDTFDDVDGDGVADILVGSAEHAWHGTVFGGGSARLLSGKTGATIWTVTELSSSDIYRFVKGTEWKHRMLIVQGTGADAETQMARLRAAARDALDRDLVVIRVGEAVASTEVGTVPALPTAEIFRQRYKMGRLQGGMEMLLVGKDGGVKERYSAVTDPADIWGTIDSMPMRQREMRGDR